MELLERKPGRNKHQISTELDISDSIMYHHLAELERAGCISILESDREQELLCFRVEDADLWLNERTRILFGRDPKRNLAIYIAENPGQTTDEIADVFGHVTATIRYHMRPLVARDLVERNRAGRTHVYDPSWGLERWVANVADGFDRPWED